MKYKTFKYKKYGECYFNVGSYMNNKQSMAISIIGKDDENIAVATVNINGWLYEPNTATIKNYSENAGMTKFLEKLGVIEEVYSKVQRNPYASKSETIDYCLIDIDKLKEYTNKFDYEWGI